jgi:subtilisin-like proprotein convertase family protein
VCPSLSRCDDSTCVLLANGFACDEGQTLVTVSSVTGVDIPDDDEEGVTLPLLVDSALTVARVMVRIDSLTHPFDGDLDISLIGGDGTVVVLSTDNGGGDADYIDTVLDDVCVGVDGPISAADAPFTGCFAPEGSLATLAGIPAAGTWSLSVVDDGIGDEGTLDGWTIGLCVE